MKRPAKNALIIQSGVSDTLVAAKKALKDDGFRIIYGNNSESVIKDLMELPIDLVVIEDSMEGEPLCEQIRHVSTVPIIVVCKHCDELRRILLLELGADHTMDSPVSNIELVARANTLLRHYHKSVA